MVIELWIVFHLIPGAPINLTGINANNNIRMELHIEAPRKCDIEQCHMPIKMAAYGADISDEIVLWKCDH